MWTRSCLLTLRGEIWLTCPGLNGRHLLLALRLSLLLWRAAGRFPHPAQSCWVFHCPAPHHPAIECYNIYNKIVLLLGIVAQLTDRSPLTCQQSNYSGQTHWLWFCSLCLSIKMDAADDWFFFVKVALGDVGDVKELNSLHCRQERLIGSCRWARFHTIVTPWNLVSIRFLLFKVCNNWLGD